MASWFSAGDLALLDRSPRKRLRAEPGELYVVAQSGEAFLRMARSRGQHLYVDAGGVPETRAQCISLNGNDILNIVKAKVVWIGRHMERKPVARETVQETRPEYRSTG
jgi:hypothetical protein